MFDFSFYTAHQRMLDLEAAGTRAFLRDETGAVISLCNDGNMYCNITTFDWTQPAVRALWVGSVLNATAQGIDGIFADHSAQEDIQIGAPKNGQGPNQLCNGKGAGRLCYNFTDAFRDSFNSWHTWATNYTQDVLSKTTGGPVVCGPYARMGVANPCDFNAVLRAQQGPLAVREMRHKTGTGSCKPSESCLAAFLAAAEPGSYLHCQYTGDDLLGASAFPEMDYALGAPNGTARETAPGSEVWVRSFASGTVVRWDDKRKLGAISWAGQPPTPAPTTPPPTPALPGSCGPVLADTGLGLADLRRTTVVGSLAECCAACHAEPACACYAWHTEEGNRCHLHTAAARPGTRGAKVGCFSGFLANATDASRAFGVSK